jgi:hypothetical protein
MIDGQAATRLVLADWKKQSGEVLCWDDGEFRVEAV